MNVIKFTFIFENVSGYIFYITKSAQKHDKYPEHIPILLLKMFVFFLD